MITIDQFITGFGEEPGYLDFASAAPLAKVARDEEQALSSLIGRARFGTLATLEAQDARVREAVAALIGFRPDQVSFQPNTSQGLMHTLFGLTGEVALAASEFPSNTFALARAQQALGTINPLWLETDHGHVTPGTLRDQLTPATVAVLVSLVDFRTGYLVDLDGIRQVIGDRLLIVNATQGFSIVDAPYEVADVIVAGGQTWARAGWGTGFLAMNDRAVEHVVPVLSGFTATDAVDLPLDEVQPPTHGVAAFSMSTPDPVAEARFSAALEGIQEVGVPAINALLAEKTGRVIDLADEFAIEVVSSRDDSARAGIVVIEPPADRLTMLNASLHNHGVSVTTRQGQIRISPHVTTEEETFSMLRASFVSFASL